MSKLIHFTNSTKSAIVDDEDYPRMHEHAWSMRKDKNTSYAQTWLTGTTICMHQLILPSNNPELEIDHIDGDGLNNQKKNLRLATPSQNRANRLKYNRLIPVSSKYKGVTWHKRDKVWNAQIRVNSKNIYLGCFKTEEGAARAYNRAATFHFGEFAKLNELPTKETKQ
jgi:hypothetical protein